MSAYYCSICRQTSFSGKSHIFEKSHQSRLRVVLLKFIEKVKEARRMVKKPQVEKFDGCRHKQTFWCYCCQHQVYKHVTDGNMTVLHGGLLQHMATQGHRRSTHTFWWENKADPKLQDKVLISEEETQRFKSEVEKALEMFEEKQDDVFKLEVDRIRTQEKQRQEVIQSLIERDAELEMVTRPIGTDEDAIRSGFLSNGSEQQADDSTVPKPNPVPKAAAGQGLTFIGYQDLSNCGNIHTGAVPPWLQDDPLEGASASGIGQQIGPSLQGFLKHKEREKLKKLPPNRVGANFDHSSYTDANWLPSFGRVWNSGRRWQSRHQFREEEKKKRRKRQRNTNSTDLN